LILNSIFMRKLLNVLLILILPLQGIAATLMPLHLSLNPAANAAMPCHEHGATAQNANAEGSTVQAPAPATPRDAEPANHLCCHQFSTCAPACALTPAARKFSDVSRLVLPLATLYIPDSPERPPRG
jgi:hypothetical protein